MLYGKNLVVPKIVTSADSTNFCSPQCLINDEKSESNLQSFLRMPEPTRDPLETFKHLKELRSYSLDSNLNYFEKVIDIEEKQFNDYIASSCPDITEYVRETNEVLMFQYSNTKNSKRNLLLSKSYSHTNSPVFLGANSFMLGGSRSQSRLSLMKTPNGSTLDLSETNSIRNNSTFHLDSSTNLLKENDDKLKIDKLSCYSYRIKCKNWLQNIMY